MKDKEARIRISSLEKPCAVGRPSLKPINPLEGISIKECPKCQHDVMVKSWEEHVGGSIPAALFRMVFQCLTCGSKFTCSTKEVCELIDGH